MKIFYAGFSYFSAGFFVFSAVFEAIITVFNFSAVFEAIQPVLLLVFQVKLAAILKMADPPIVTHTFSPNKPDFLFIDIHWPPKPLVLEKKSHFGNPNNTCTK